MILALWITFAVIAFGALVVGYWTDVPYYTFIGLFFFFILGGVILADQLELKTGKTISYAYTPGYCYDNCTIQATLLGAQETDQYTAFTGDYAHWFGFFLSVVSGLGMGVVFIEETKRRRERAEDD